MNTKHGFLTLDAGATVLYVDNCIWQPLYTERPAELIDMAHRAGLTHLWILPDYPIVFAPDGVIWSDEKRKSGKLVTASHNMLLYMGDLKDRPARPIASITGHADKKKNVSVIFLSESAWSYTDLDAFRTFIDHVEGGLGVAMKGSPATVGLRYLENVLPADTFEDPGIEKAAMGPMFKFTADSLKGFRWATPEELRKPYLVCCDKRAAFPRGAQEERYGVGPAQYQEGGEFNPKLAGIWYGRVSGLERLPPLLLPPLWDKANPEDEGLVTPIVKCLLKLGCEFEVTGAFVWPDSRPVFKKWVDSLWALRKEHDQYKNVMNNTIGIFGQGDNPGNKMYRPDWYRTTVGSTRALVLYNILSFFEKTGMWAVGSWIDALYYFSDTPEIPAICAQSESLGGYAYKWAIPVDEQVRSLLTSAQELAEPNMLIGKLNRVAGESNE